MSLRQDWWDGARWHFGILDQGTPCQSPSLCNNVLFGASVAAVGYGGQLQVFSDEFTNASYDPILAPAYLEHDWWNGTRWNHQSLSGRVVDQTVFPTPDNAVTVYNGQLHVFTYCSGVSTNSALLDVWWG